MKYAIIENDIIKAVFAVPQDIDGIVGIEDDDPRLAAYYAPSAEMIAAQKRKAYQTESDPLFFKWQAGEGTEQAWLDKRAEIDARFS